MEQRRFSRYVFRNDERMTALFDYNGGAIQAGILNISQGGLGLMFERGDNGDLMKEGTILFLKEVVGYEGLAALKGHSLKVKWVLDYEPLHNLAVGCEFIDLTSDCRKAIDGLLTSG
jgi:hypothetical protein